MDTAILARHYNRKAPKDIKSESRLFQTIISQFNQKADVKMRNPVNPNKAKLTERGIKFPESPTAIQTLSSLQAPTPPQVPIFYLGNIGNQTPFPYMVASPSVGGLSGINTYPTVYPNVPPVDSFCTTDPSRMSQPVYPNVPPVDIFCTTDQSRMSQPVYPNVPPVDIFCTTDPSRMSCEISPTTMDGYKTNITVSQQSGATVGLDMFRGSGEKVDLEEKLPPKKRKYLPLGYD